MCAGADTARVNGTLIVHGLGAGRTHTTTATAGQEPRKTARLRRWERADQRQVAPAQHSSTTWAAHSALSNMDTIAGVEARAWSKMRAPQTRTATHQCTERRRTTSRDEKATSSPFTTTWCLALRHLLRAPPVACDPRGAGVRRGQGASSHESQSCQSCSNISCWVGTREAASNLPWQTARGAHF